MPPDRDPFARLLEAQDRLDDLRPGSNPPTRAAAEEAWRRAYFAAMRKLSPGGFRNAHGFHFQRKTDRLEYGPIPSDERMAS